MDVTKEAIIGFIPDADWALQRFSRKYVCTVWDVRHHMASPSRKLVTFTEPTPDMLVEKA